MNTSLALQLFNLVVSVAWSALATTAGTALSGAMPPDASTCRAACRYETASGDGGVVPVWSFTLPFPYRPLRAEAGTLVTACSMTIGAALAAVATDASWTAHIETVAPEILAEPGGTNRIANIRPHAKRLADGYSSAFSLLAKAHEQSLRGR